MSDDYDNYELYSDSDFDHDREMQLIAKIFTAHAIPNADEGDIENIKRRILNRAAFDAEKTTRDELWQIAFTTEELPNFSDGEELKRCFLMAAKQWDFNEFADAVHHLNSLLEEDGVIADDDDE